MQEVKPMIIGERRSNNVENFNNALKWGYSSVGRALDWQSRGGGFDSP